MRLIDHRNSEYISNISEWNKYRSAYIGGATFTKDYLKSYSKLEDNADFRERVSMTYPPSVAKTSIQMIANSVGQNMTAVSRTGGPASYQDALQVGADMDQRSIPAFIQQVVLTEMLPMKRVGVYVDKPPMPLQTTRDAATRYRPYIYHYKTEDILAWSKDRGRYTALLLREYRPQVDETGLESGIMTLYRYIRQTDSGIVIQYYDKDNRQVDQTGRHYGVYDYSVNLPAIPFVMFELSEALMTDVAQMQVALLNLESSDIAFCIKSNVPFYTEQFDPRTEAMQLEGINAPTDNSEVDGVILTETEAQAKARYATSRDQIKVGVTTGRRYSIGTEKPAFIHPSPECLKASMEKEREIRETIKELLNLSLSRVRSTSVVSDDNSQSFDAGLRNIGLELEHGERQLAEYWAMYERSEPAIIKYPDDYQIKTDKQRREEVTDMNKQRSAIPSPTYQREVAKDIVEAQFRGKRDSETIEKMKNEIETASTMTSSADEIAQDLENGLVGEETASLARGYPQGEVEKARKDHAARIARIQAAQTSNMAARGVDDVDPNPRSGEAERLLATRSDEDINTRQRKVRGRGRKNSLSNAN